MSAKRTPASMLSLKHPDLGQAQLGDRANVNPTLRKRDTKAAERKEAPEIVQYVLRSYNEECTFCQQIFDCPSQLAQHWERTHLHKGRGMQYTITFGSLKCYACPRDKRKIYTQAKNLTLHLMNPKNHGVGELLD
jgi:hypothetical protein